MWGLVFGFFFLLFPKPRCPPMYPGAGTLVQRGHTGCTGVRRGSVGVDRGSMGVHRGFMGVQRGHRGLWGCRGVLGGLWGCTGVHSAARGGVCGAAERCQEVQGGAVGCTGLCGGLHGGVSGGAGTLEVGSGHRTGSCHPPSPNQFVTRPLIPLIRPQPEPPHLLN